MKPIHFIVNLSNTEIDVQNEVPAPVWLWWSLHVTVLGIPGMVSGSVSIDSEWFSYVGRYNFCFVLCITFEVHRNTLGTQWSYSGDCQLISLKSTLKLNMSLACILYIMQGDNPWSHMHSSIVTNYYFCIVSYFS